MRKISINREAICKLSALMSKETKKKKFPASVERFTELEEKLYIWIDSMRQANFPVPSSIAILKAKKSLNNYRYHRRTSKHYGNSLTDLENAEDYNNFFKLMPFENVSSARDKKKI